jgi:hypothetical protein
MADMAITDPLGRVITLHDRTWFGHVLKGHPEVADCRRLVETAIERPLEIRRSRTDEDCRLYFGQGPRPGVMMLVVADVVRCFVKTAHLCDRVSGGAVEWSRSM